MASINVRVPHKLTREEALKRTKNLLTKTKEDFSEDIKNLKEIWNDNAGKFSFAAKGFEISGTLTVKDSEIILDGTVPFAVSLFKGKITKKIQEVGAELLA